jgi:hypothetical protein
MEKENVSERVRTALRPTLIAKPGQRIDKLDSGVTLQSVKGGNATSLLNGSGFTSSGSIPHLEDTDERADELETGGAFSVHSVTGGYVTMLLKGSDVENSRKFLVLSRSRLVRVKLFTWSLI